MCLQVFGRFSDDFSVLNKICEKFCEKRLTIAVFWRVLEKLRKFAYFRVGGWSRGCAPRCDFQIALADWLTLFTIQYVLKKRSLEGAGQLWQLFECALDIKEVSSKIFKSKINLKNYFSWYHVTLGMNTLCILERRTKSVAHLSF